MDTRGITKELRLAHWGALLNEKATSGKKIKDWCAEQGICTKTYYYWQNKLREAAYHKLNTNTPKGFVEVTCSGQISSGTASLETIELSSSLAVNGSTDDRALAEMPDGSVFNKSHPGQVEALDLSERQKLAEGEIRIEVAGFSISANDSYPAAKIVEVLRGIKIC